MSKKEITFQEIVQMIADKSVPEGAVFYAPKVQGWGSDLISAKYVRGTLTWTEGAEVHISPAVINDTWYIEVPEVELTMTEAFQEFKEYRNVKAVHKETGKVVMIDHSWDLDDICDYTDIEYPEDLLDYTFYKAEQ